MKRFLWLLLACLLLSACAAGGAVSSDTTVPLETTVPTDTAVPTGTDAPSKKLFHSFGITEPPPLINWDPSLRSFDPPDFSPVLIAGMADWAALYANGWEEITAPPEYPEFGPAFLPAFFTDAFFEEYVLALIFIEFSGQNYAYFEAESVNPETGEIVWFERGYEAPGFAPVISASTLLVVIDKEQWRAGGVYPAPSADSALLKEASVHAGRTHQQDFQADLERLWDFTALYR